MLTYCHKSSQSCNQTFHHHRKGFVPIPLPAGAPKGCYAKGQPGTPINHHNQGEVLTPPIEKFVFICYRSEWGGIKIENTEINLFI